jgi:DNA-binding transcriptional LysR family regulator
MVIMYLKHLRSFTILAEELHFGRAARRLNIVQPALSKQMKVLEQEVGCLLLDRNRRGVTLSEGGRYFLAEARQALEHVERAIEAARRVGTGKLGLVRIGYSASATHSGALASALASIEEVLPEIEVRLERVEPWEQKERLLANEVDLVFGPVLLQEPQALKVHCLADLAVVAAMSAKHPLADKSVIELDDIKAEVFIEFANSEQEGLAVIESLTGLRPGAVIAKPDPIAILALVQARRGICVLPSVLQLPDFPQVIYKPLRTSSTVKLAMIGRRHDDDPLLRNIEEIFAGCCQVDGDQTCASRSG